MTKPTETTPATVPLAQQAGETLSRWRWVQPCAWTVRMLTTLEQGVEGGKWFRLFDKVFAERNLWAAFQQVAANRGAAGVDHVTVQEFQRRLPDSLWELADQLRSGTYQPQAVRRTYIPKPGSTETRPLGIPTVKDRVVQMAVKLVIEPIFEADFVPCSFGFRPEKTPRMALSIIAEKTQAGYSHVVDVDLKSYLDTASYCPLIHESSSNKSGI